MLNFFFSNLRPCKIGITKFQSKCDPDWKWRPSFSISIFCPEEHRWSSEPQIAGDTHTHTLWYVDVVIGQAIESVPQIRSDPTLTKRFNLNLYIESVCVKVLLIIIILPQYLPFNTHSVCGPVFFSFDKLTKSMLTFSKKVKEMTVWFSLFNQWPLGYSLLLRVLTSLKLKRSL